MRKVVPDDAARDGQEEEEALESLGIREAEDRHDDEEDGDFRVWQENWETVQVFRKCAGSWDVVAVLGGTAYQGIRLTEIESAMRIMNITENKSQIADDVGYMASKAAEVLNRE